MKVLVTGATGFTGGYLARKLVERGDIVRALVRPSTDASEVAQAGIEVARGDLRDPEAVERAVRGVDKVYHIAAAFRIAGQPDRYYREVNVDGTKNVLDAACKHDVERVIHCSTIGVHGDTGKEPVDEEAPLRPGDVYQATKLEGELLAAKAFSGRQRGVIFRPGGIYGPGDTRFLKLFRALYHRRFVMLGTGDVQYQLIYIDDLVDGILKCSSRDQALGNTYILTGDKSFTLNKFIELVSEAVGVATPKLRIPLWPVLAMSHVCEAACKLLHVSPPIYPRRVDFFRKERSFLIDKAKRELGFSPTVAPAEGLRRTAEWYFEHGLLAKRREGP